MKKDFYKSFEIGFVIDGKTVGESIIMVCDGIVHTQSAEDEFYSVLRKNEKSLLKEAEEEEKGVMVDSLTKMDESKLRDEHAKDYHGMDDDMPDSFESWLEDLSVAELKELL